MAYIVQPMIISPPAHHRNSSSPYLCSWDEWVPESRLVRNDAAGQARQKQLRELQKQANALLVSNGSTSKDKERDNVTPVGSGSSGGPGGLKVGPGTIGGPPVEGKGKGKEREVVVVGNGNGKGGSGRKRTRGEAFDTVRAVATPLSNFDVVHSPAHTLRECHTGGPIHETTRSQDTNPRHTKDETRG